MTAPAPAKPLPDDILAVARALAILHARQDHKAELERAAQRKGNEHG